MSSSSATTPSPQEPASAVSSRAGTPPSSAHLDPRKAVLCEVEPVEFKSLQDEIRAHKDLTAFAEEASVVLDVRAGGPGDIVDALLARLVEEDRLPAEAVASARKGLLGREPVLAGERVVKAGSRDNENDGAAAGEVLPQPAVSGGGGGGGGGDGEVRGKSHWHRHIQGPGFIVPFARIAELDAVNERVVAIARLREPCRLGVVEGGLTQFVVAVLTPAKDMKDLKGPFELGRSFASLLQDDEFYAEARKVGGEEGFREAMRSFLERNRGIEEGAAAAGGMRKRKGGFGRKNAGDGDGDGEGEKAVDSGESSMEVPRESDEKPSDAVFARTGRFAGGLIDDIRRRYKWSVYKSDWTDGIGDGPSMLKYLSTIVWLYFAIIMPTIAFGALDDEHTNGAIGVIETLVSQAAAGLVFASFAGQPLTIVMTTAPLTVFIEVLFSWSKSLKIPFLPFYAWTGIWTAAILIVLVLTDSVAIMKYCGHFTEEIFAMLIAALFVGEYGKKLVDIARKEETEVFLLAFILATGTYLIAHWLLVFKRSFLLKPIIRLLLSDFGVPIAILIMSGVRQAFKGVKAEMLAVPAEIGIVTTNGRPWLVPLFDISIQYIFLAGVAGVLLAMLFFLDQNISSLLVCRPENRLKKGPGYYIDLVVVSVIVVVQSVFGMPWTHAALPHSPLHARQLADVEEYEAHGRRYERVILSRETRWTGFVTHILIGLSILLKDALGKIPLAVLYGFFLYMGIATLDGNALWDRVLLLVTQKERYPANHYVRRVPIKRIHLYTFIQLALLVILWFFKSNFYLGDTVFNTGLLFPFVIAMFIPVRLYILPRLFSAKQLEALSHEESPDISDEGITV